MRTPLDREIETLEARLTDLHAIRHKAEHRPVKYRQPIPTEPTVMTMDDYRRLWIAARSLRDTEGWRHRIECRVRQLRDSQNAA